MENKSPASDCKTRLNFNRLKMKTDVMNLNLDDKVLSTIEPETEPAALSSKVFICTPQINDQSKPSVLRKFCLFVF